MTQFMKLVFFYSEVDMKQKKNFARTNSNLLVNETPIIISKTLANVLNDEHKSMLLNFIYYFTKDFDQKKYKEGYSWCYFSISELQEKFFQHLSTTTLYRILKGLEEDNLIITGRYNRLKYDRTKWYRINFEELDKILPNFKRNDKNQYEPNCQNERFEFINSSNGIINLDEDGIQSEESISTDKEIQSIQTDVTNTIETKETSIETIGENDSESNLSSYDKLPEDKSSGQTDTSIQNYKKEIYDNQSNSVGSVTNQQLVMEKLKNLSTEERREFLDSLF